MVVRYNSLRNTRLVNTDECEKYFCVAMKEEINATIRLRLNNILTKEVDNSFALSIVIIACTMSTTYPAVTNFEPVHVRLTISD